jgi:MFS family permease
MADRKHCSQWHARSAPPGLQWLPEDDRRRPQRRSLDACANSRSSSACLAGSLVWFGVGFGDIVMGQIADRVGVRWTVMFGAVMICVGLAISSFGGAWQLYLGHGLFIGFLGNGGL